MLVQSSDEYLIKEMDADFNNLVSVKIAEKIFTMILVNLGEVIIKVGRLYLLKKVYGTDWRANINAAHRVIACCSDKYECLGGLVDRVDVRLGGLEQVDRDGEDWANVECILCLELVTGRAFGLWDDQLQTYVSSQLLVGVPTGQARHGMLKWSLPHVYG